MLTRNKWLFFTGPDAMWGNYLGLMGATLLFFLSAGPAPVFAQDADLDTYLSRKDENQNGMLEPEEIANGRTLKNAIERGIKDRQVSQNQASLPIAKAKTVMLRYKNDMVKEGRWNIDAGGGGGGFGGGPGGGGPGGGGPWGGGGPGGGPWGGRGGPGGGEGGPWGGRGGPGGEGGPWGGRGGPGGGEGGPWGGDRERNRDNASESGSGGGKKSERKSSGEAPGVPGFGVAREIPEIKGFGGALQSAAADKSDVGRDPPPENRENRDGPRENRDRENREVVTNPGNPAPGGPRGGPGGGPGPGRDREREDRERREKTKEAARSMIKQYDKNKDDVLSKAEGEWDKFRGDPSNADYNKDGIITHDELTDRLVEKSREGMGGGGAGPGPGGGGYGGGGGYASKPSVGANGKPLRHLTPTERLPEGLPGYFLRNDTNGDGQVSMSEYAASYSNEKAAEFMRIDANGDGIITPAECLAAERRK
ncbi:MAG: hypothetical protein SFX18_03585 [Pirellulales bacterium]|nr:hypothetical protein [Pirellulales bacterium]